jgi:hypothetical protein
LISPNHKSSVTRPPSSSRRWQPAGSGHCAAAVLPRGPAPASAGAPGADRLSLRGIFRN